MSIRLVDLVLRNYHAEPAKKLVLVALANFANDDNICWPYVDTIAAKACQSLRNTRYVLKQLRAEGLIQNVSAGRGGRRGDKGIPNRIRLTLQTLHPKAELPGNTAQPTLQAATPTLQAVADKTVIRTVTNNNRQGLPPELRNESSEMLRVIARSSLTRNEKIPVHLIPYLTDEDRQRATGEGLIQEVFRVTGVDGQRVWSGMGVGSHDAPRPA